MFFYYKPNDKITSIKIRFELLDNPMIDELTCGICLELFDKPTQTECSHRFCKKCITKYFETEYFKNCPICRTSISKANLKLDPFVDSIMSKLKVKCSEQNCIDTFTLNDIKKHIDDECDYTSRMCKFNCGKKFIKKNINEHEDRCFYNPTVEINCERCNEKIFAVNLNEHYKKTCQETSMKCKFGCENRIKRKNLENHYDEFAKIHADRMLKNNKILNEKLNEKEEIIDIGHHRINELQEKIDNISKYVKTITPPASYGEMESFEHYENIHKGFGRYEYYMPWYTYKVIINKVKELVQPPVVKCSKARSGILI
jgi:hypothetical protein